MDRPVTQARHTSRSHKPVTVTARPVPLKWPSWRGRGSAYAPGMRIRIVDAFTDRPFAGNPAGVLLLDSDAFPDDGWLQRVAAELNLSETAFAHRLAGSPDADWALRWFTPLAEVDLCGHATLAT